jgi:hypothetical protein
VPLGSFSSDELWIVWEFVGGNGFYWGTTWNFEENRNIPNKTHALKKHDMAIK